VPTTTPTPSSAITASVPAPDGDPARPQSATRVRTAAVAPEQANSSSRKARSSVADRLRHDSGPNPDRTDIVIEAEAEAEVDTAAEVDGLSAATEFDYAAVNRALFDRRAEILTELDELEKIGMERRCRRLRRNLDDIETEIVNANRGLVMSYVRRFTTKGRQRGAEDFEAAGIAGLVAAMKTYDSSRGPFAQWAYHPIQRAVTRAVRDLDHSNLNPGDFEKRPDILRARERLVAAGQPHDDTAVALEARTTINQVKRVLQAPRLVSTEQPVGDDGDLTVAEVVAGDDEVEAQVIGTLDLVALEEYGLTVLDQREMLVLTRHYGLDGNAPMKLAAIGADLRLSREAARQIEAKALAKLTHPNVLRRLVRQRA
jgi:RNA polymerase sigma factor (sigma-70 family)